MKISEGLKEDGIVVGNAYDKYGSRNPIVRRIMFGFESALSDLVAEASPRTIHEIGCGEGIHTLQWAAEEYDVRGSDFSSKIIGIARENALAQGMSPDIFKTLSIYDLRSGIDSADLLVCCEVLEHLEFPEKALEALREVAESGVILTVPREPLWRALNLMRGKYVANLGNTPGHIQHWSTSGFMRLVSRYFSIDEVRTPIPWTMLLCSRRH